MQSLGLFVRPPTWLGFAQVWLWVWGESYNHQGKSLRRWPSWCYRRPTFGIRLQCWGVRLVLWLGDLNQGERWPHNAFSRQMKNTSKQIVLLSSAFLRAQGRSTSPKQEVTYMVSLPHGICVARMSIEVFLSSSSNTGPSSLLRITDPSKVTREETAKQNVTGKMSKINDPSTGMGNAGLRNKHCIWSLKIEQTRHSSLWHLKPTWKSA